ncbi:D-lactate dehydrogenase [Xylona heveae TC161]|uniref:D-lactate dehydrogenase (cytochrome) n=1 Tax=Xylona heveae (strain CBS 132557 / TC161) TaxID=1328760 RepID=A0A165GB39_XYLHT|nr:D-lactate dehydrogenase [Xylona heveae TC161]KZF21972.1 D-lactate dehydrogenase [Xylona heveae TC161]
MAAPRANYISLASSWRGLRAPTSRLGHTPVATSRQAYRQTLSNRRYFSSPKGEPERSFRAQLYESTAQRVKRERAEQRKLAEQSSIWETSGARRGALTFVILSSSLFCYFLGSSTVGQPSTASTTTLAEAKAPRHDTSPRNLQSSWADLVAIVGQDNVSTQEGDIRNHSGSEWSSYEVQENDRPFAIVRPASTEEVSEIVKVCYKRRIPITPYSGGTSLEGHFAATRGGICIDFSRMDKVLALHKNDLDVIVQPAVGWESLNEELAQEGLFFPPDPGPGAMIGGMVGTGCSGTNAYRYGTMRDWVLSLTIVLADGTIIKTRQRPRKSSAGYDLTRMFIGSEGTLGLVTEATLKVTVKPKEESVAVASFGTVRQAADCVAKVVGEGIPVAAIEILDDVQMRVINESGATSRSWKEVPTLFFKFAGTPASVKEHISIVKQLAKSKGSKSFEFATSKDEAVELWSARKQALFSVMSLKRDAGDHVWTTDVAVPISRLPDIIEETKEDMTKSGLLGAIVGHAGDGNFHAILLHNDKERQKTEELVHRLVKRALEMEGTATGEHGVGLIKRDYLEHELNQDTVDAMRRLKQAFDPLCLLNCDKVVRVQKPKRGEIHEW